MVGTVSHNKRFLPKALQIVKGRQNESSVFAYRLNPSITLTSYIPRKNKNVILMSTLHHDGQIDRNDRNKPEIMKFYNNTKFGVDTLDQLVGNYTCKRRTNRWPMAVFSAIVDVSACNALVIFLECNENWPHANKKKRRREFLKQLSHSLIGPEIARRSKIPNQSNAAELVHSLKRKRVESDIQASSSSESTPKSRKRCHLCVANRNQHSQTCSVCSKNICKAHSKLICDTCQ